MCKERYNRPNRAIHLNRPCPCRPTCRGSGPSMARHNESCRPGPSLCGPGRAWTGPNRAVLRAARLAQPIWPSIFIHHDFRIWSPLDSRILLIPVSGASQVHDSRASQVRDSRASHIHDSRASQVSSILRWTADPHEEARFGYHFRTLLENLKNTQKPIRVPLQTFRFHETGLSFQKWFANLSHEFRQTRRSEGVSFSWILQHRATLCHQGPATPIKFAKSNGNYCSLLFI
jgi:hypothetical protein